MSRHRLLHLKSFKFEGVITGLSAVSTNIFLSATESNDIGLFEKSFDYLMISFFPQKVSIVAYNENEDLLKTISLISFDEAYTEKDLSVRLPLRFNS